MRLVPRKRDNSRSHHSHAPAFEDRGRPSPDDVDLVVLRWHRKSSGLLKGCPPWKASMSPFAISHQTCRGGEATEETGERKREGVRGRREQNETNTGGGGYFLLLELARRARRYSAKKATRKTSKRNRCLFFEMRLQEA